MLKSHEIDKLKNKKSISPIEKFKKERIGLTNTAENG